MLSWVKCIFVKHKFRAYAITYLDWDSEEEHIHKRRGLLFRCKKCGLIVKGKAKDTSNIEDLE